MRLGDLNKWYRSSATNADLTLQFVHFMRQIMKGISYLHRCNSPQRCKTRKHFGEVFTTDLSPNWPILDFAKFLRKGIRQL